MSDQVDVELQPYTFLFRNTSDGIILADNTLTIKQINPAAAAMLGVTADEIVGRQPRQAFPTSPALVNLFVREGNQTLDIRLPRRRLSVGTATTLETGERMVLLNDVTEKRDLENRRESLIKAMTHDLRNPITAINGFADLVVKFGELNDHQQKFMTRIRQTSAKLYDVIGPLVDLAWIEAGMPLEHVPLQLHDVINRAVGRVTATAHEQKVVVAVSVQNPLPLVIGDPVRLEQVVFNLLHNAIIYSNIQQNVVIHAWSDQEDVYCSVADQGIGIDDSEIDRIFDRMYRSQDEHVRNIAGGGLGLTVAKTIIVRHGGDMWAVGNLGEGSTFTFVLPMAES